MRGSTLRMYTSILDNVCKEAYIVHANNYVCMYVHTHTHV